MRFAWLAALCLLVPATVTARTYSVEDLLGVQDYGRALFSPTGDRVVVERLGGQKSAARFTYDYFVRRARSRVMVAPISGTGGLKPLFPQSPAGGYWIGSFSPSGRRLSVFRIQDDRLSLGVVDMVTRRVSWLVDSPDQPPGQAVPAWLDDDRLLVVANPAGRLPFPLDFGGRAQKQFPGFWERTARGRDAAMTIVGSGAYLQAGTVPVRRRLMLVDVAQRSTRTLATGDVVDFSLAPGGRHVALLERGDAVPAPPASQPFSLDFQSRRLRVRIVALDGAVTAPCPACDLAPDLLAWSGDGSQLLFLARQDGEPWNRALLYAHDLRKERAATLDTQGVVPSLVRTTPGRATARAGWFGNRPILFGTPRSGRADWFLLGDKGATGLTGALSAAPAGPIRVGTGALCLLDRDGFWAIGSDGTARSEVAGEGLTIVSDPSGSYDIGTRPLLAPVRDSASVWLRRPGVNGADLVEAGCGKSWLRPVAHIGLDTKVLAVAPGTGVGLTLTVSPEGVGTLSLVGAGARPLDRINSALLGFERPVAMALRRTGPSGLVTDWLLLPPHADPGTLLPLVITPYPGTILGDTRPSDFSLADFEPTLSPPMLAAHGYAVLKPSMPIGSAEPVDDIITALRPAIAAALGTGRVDAARIGVVGHSYGGYTALLMATELPCLRSVVASASASDLLLAYGSFDPHATLDLASGMSTIFPFAWAEDGQGRMGVPPWQDPARYLRNSPFYRLDRVTAPILLFHGDLDPVPVTQAERTYAALYRLGKDARLVRFYGEGHVPQSPATIRVRWRETFAWLDRTMPLHGIGRGPAFDLTGLCAAPSTP
jgi:dipeptidyl aminopeptidase/acylaminoacyl peptidase